jgi:hypothetical protein
MASDPGPFLREILEPVRAIADEIVLCAGGPLSEEDLGCYADVADRLFVLEEFGHVERHLAWLHAQCSGDWILRLDGDEVPSEALLEAIAEVVRDPLLQGAYVPRAHVHPTTATFIAGQPWWPDYQLRLYRNDGLLRFPGTLHSGAERTLPARMLEAPLYHLSLLLTDDSARIARSERYELLRPGLRAPTGIPANDMLFPERYPWVPTAPVPAADRRRLEEVVAAGGPPRGGGPEPVAVPLADADAFWTGRTVGKAGLDAEVSLFGPLQPLAPGERREWHVRVRNTGTETWPWDASLAPYVHLVSRIATSGDEVAEAWHVDFLMEWMTPGTEAIIAVLPAAPEAEGRHVLEVRVRHAEHGFVGEPLRVEVDVRAGGAAVAPARQAGPRIAERLRARLARPGS